MGIHIRHAGPGDEPAVVGLIRELADDGAAATDEHYVRHFLASPVGDVLLAVDGRVVVGLLSYAVVPSLFHAADSGLIESLVVTEDRRREGIGRELVRTAMRILDNARCAEISVSTGPDNDIAQRLYCGLGLTEASVLLEKHVER